MTQTFIAIHCVCGQDFDMPLNDRNGKWEDHERLAFFHTCPHCRRTVQVTFSEETITFHKED